MLKITLKQLEVFKAIASYKTMNEAAATLHMTQSACSMALSNLENQLDGTLFDRHGKRLLLNARGRILLPQVNNILSLVLNAQDSMLAQDSLAAHLLIGASTTVGNYLLPHYIGQFLQRHPMATSSLYVNNTEQVIQELLNFSIDIGFIEGNCYHKKINVMPWKKDELIIIAAPKYFTKNYRFTTKQELCKQKWILREAGSGTRLIFEEKLKARIQPYLELGHTEAIKQAVIAGIGISCVSKLTVQNELENGKLVEIKAPFINLTRDLYIISHKDKAKYAALTEFIKICQA